MNILAIDTSNEILGVAIQKDGKVVAEKMTNIKKDHSSRLMPAIVRLMEHVGMNPDQLNQIVVGRGPGSYTGVRIGVTTAKALAWSLEIPIIPVSSLRALAYNGMYFNGYIWTFFNARRNAMFAALYKYEEGQLQDVIEERYVTLEDWFEQLEEYKEEKILCISPHVEIFKENINEHLDQRIVFPPKSNHLLRPSHLITESKVAEEVPVHLVKPHYLRITEAEANLLKGQKK